MLWITFVLSTTAYGKKAQTQKADCPKKQSAGITTPDFSKTVPDESGRGFIQILLL